MLSATNPLNLRAWPEGWTSRLLSVLRIVAAFLFIAHGTQKLFGFPADPRGGPSDLTPLMAAAGIMETFGSTLLLLGLLTRPIAFLLSGEMAFAYFMRHAPQGFWPALNGGELSALYCFLWLFFVFAGPGVWSLDALWDRRRQRAILAQTPRSSLSLEPAVAGGRWHSPGREDT